MTVTHKITPPTTGTPEMRAVAITLGILAHTGHPTWVAFASDYNQHGPTVLRGLSVDEDTRRLLDEQAWLVNRVSVTPPVTCAQCDRCGRVTFTATGKDAPCWLTLDCVGKTTTPPPVKTTSVDQQNALIPVE